MPICWFCHARFDADLSCCPKCGAAQNPNQNRSGFGKFINLILLGAVLSLLLWGTGRSLPNYLDQTQPTLIALDARTSQVAWSAPLSGGLERFTTAEQGRVFVATAIDRTKEFSGERYQRYQIQAFEAASGRKLWTFSPQLSEPYRSEDMLSGLPPYVHDDTVWVNVLLDRTLQGKVITRDRTSGQTVEQIGALPNLRNGQVIALNAANGKPKWSIDRDWSIEWIDHIGIVDRGDRSAILRITPTQEILLEVYDSSTGKPLWQVQADRLPRWENWPANLFRRYQFAANSATLFLVDRSQHKLYGYDWKTGQRKVAINTDGEIELTDSTLYSLSGLSKSLLKAFDPNTGIRRWTASFPNCLYSVDDIEAVADEVYLACSGSVDFQPQIKVLRLDSKTGRDRWSSQVSNRSWGQDSQSNALAHSSEAVVAIALSRDGNSDQVIAFSRMDGRELWRWTPKFEIQQGSISAEGDRVFVLAQVPRWRHLIGAIDNGSHQSNDVTE